MLLFLPSCQNKYEVQMKMAKIEFCKIEKLETEWHKRNNNNELMLQMDSILNIVKQHAINSGNPKKFSLEIAKYLCE